MPKHLGASFIVLAALTLVSCSDPKAATEKNFMKAISAYLTYRDTQGDFCIENHTYPVAAHGLGALADLGFVKQVGTKRNLYGPDIPIYDLTDNGRTLYTAGKGFCYGQPILLRILTFSEPSSFGPYTMSQVQYEYSIGKIPEWVHQKSILKGYPWIETAVASQKQPIKDKATLILTNNGWVHQKLFEK